MMLVLGRRKNQSIRIGGDVTVTVVEAPCLIKLGIDAPRDLHIERCDIQRANGPDRISLREAAESVVATVYGNPHGLSEADQLRAIRLATGNLIEALSA